MSFGRSKKPCIGCGKLPDPDHGSWSAAKPLCHECETAIAKYPKARAVLDRALKRQLKTVQLPHDSDCVWPLYDRWSDDRQYRTFRSAFNDLLIALSEPAVRAEGEKLVERMPVSWSRELFRTFDAKVVPALRKVLEAACTLSKNAYAEGQEHGASLLGNLLEGSVTNEEINKICAKDNKG